MDTKIYSYATHETNIPSCQAKSSLPLVTDHLVYVKSGFKIND